MFEIKQKPGAGVTMIELLVATTVLAMLLTAVFSVFRSGSRSFSSGSWRIQNQKLLQVFLARLKDYLEKANYAHEIGKDGNLAKQELPICINKNALGKDLNVRGTNTDLLFFGVTESYKQGQPDYGVPTKNGSWLGVGLFSRGSKLILKAEGDWDKFAADCAPPAEIRPADQVKFPGRNNMEINISLDDVESVTIGKPTTVSAEKENGHMKIKVTLRQYEGSKPTESFISEEIGVSLIEPNPSVQEF